MSKEKDREKREPAPLYPFLFSLYPVLHLFLRNIREVPWAQALWAAAASLGIALAFWPLTKLVSRRPEKRSLALFIFLLLFQFYGLYYGQVAGLLPADRSPLAAHAIALFIPAAACVFLVYLLIRSRSSFSAWNRILGIAVLALLVWNGAGILVHAGGALAGSFKKSRAASLYLRKTVGAPPDIYCFVLDEFAAPESARRLFAFDPAPFVASLRRRGFAVAAKSKARFVMTEPAIADILNLGRFSGEADPFPAIRRSAVVAILKQHGYRIIDFACQKPLFLEAADRRIYYDLSRASIFFDEFYRTLFERSLLRILPDAWRRRKTDLVPFYRQRVLQVFSGLPAAVAEPSPKFVFVHLFSPHEPFVFAANGEAGDADRIWDHSDPRRYLGQYIYIQRRVLEAVDMILGKSQRPPVILLQSDHGYRGSRRRGNPIPRAEMVEVLNALYLPGAPPATIDPAMSPRNNFRLVFNRYLGCDYPLLPNP